MRDLAQRTVGMDENARFASDLSCGRCGNAKARGATADTGSFGKGLQRPEQIERLEAVDYEESYFARLDHEKILGRAMSVRKDNQQTNSDSK